MKKNELVRIVAQAFYGNRTCTKVRRDDVDAFIQGYIDVKLFDGKNIDRTIVKVPGTDNIVIVYNSIMEKRARKDKDKYFEKDGYMLEPLAVIPEKDLEIYSRCIVCRMNEDGELESLEKEDLGKFMHYLAE